MKICSRRSELVDKVSNFCTLLCAAELLLSVYSEKARSSLTVLVVPDYGHIFLPPPFMLDRNNYIDTVAMCKIFPISDTDLELFKRICSEISFICHETIVSSILFYAEEYALFGTIARQTPDKSNLTTGLMSMFHKDNSDMCKVEMLEDSVFYNMDMDAIADSFDIYGFYESVMYSLHVAFKHPPFEDLLYEILLEEAAIKIHLGHQQQFCDNTCPSNFIYTSSVPATRKNNLTVLTGDAARTAVIDVNEEFDGLDLTSNVDMFVNGVYYEGRYPLNKNELSFVEEVMCYV